MKIHCFQHVEFENPGTIKEWAESHHHSINYTYFFEENYSIPPINEIDTLLIMGGFMNVDEEARFPWLIKEKEFIKEVINGGKKVIGICLGAQLIAAALGNKIYKGTDKEIGFFPIAFTVEALQDPLFDHFKNPYIVFHWHSDTFDLPANALQVASSAVCANQAFLIGVNVLGLQFHIEMNEALIEDMLMHDGLELKESGKFIQKPGIMRKHFHLLQDNKRDLFLLLDKFFAFT